MVEKVTDTYITWRDPDDDGSYHGRVYLKARAAPWSRTADAATIVVYKGEMEIPFTLGLSELHELLTKLEEMAAERRKVLSDARQP